MNVAEAAGVDVYMRIPLGPFLEYPPFVNDPTLVERLHGRGLTPPESLVSKSMPALLAEMAAAGIGLGFVPARAGVTNEEVVTVLAGWEHVFKALGMVRDGARTADDVAFCDAHMVACMLEPGLQQPPRHVDSDELKTLYGAVSDAGLPLMLMCGGKSAPDLSYVALDRLDRIAVAFPRLTLVIVHGGWPRITDAIAVAYHRPNVYLSPDLFWVSAPGSEQYVAAANGILREKMVMGTGYPRSNHGEVVGGLRRIGLTDEAWHAISSENPRRVFPRAFAGDR